MHLPYRMIRIVNRRRRFRLSPTQIIALAFLGIILLGALLLMLPVASRNGESAGFLPSLFTATSATCVTGLVLFDTWTQWSGFGQAVILMLIEIGGLGFMSAAALVVFVLRKKVGLRQRMVMAQALSLNDMDGVVRLQKWVLIGSLGIQGLGALVLFFRFLPEFGIATALKWGVFHAVSAFCNAGFDIFGSIAPGASTTVFNTDPVVSITLAILIALGGLGFFVWEEVVRLRSFRKLSVYTKLVLLTTLALILGGMVCFCILEWNNPATFGGMSVGEKLLNAFFQSVTTRTAGFASVDQAALTDGGKAVTMVLMFIGGSSGSTAGGVKTVTLVTLLLFMWSRARGRNSVCVFRRTIAQEKVLDALTIVTLMLGLAIFGGIFICTTCPVGFTDALYESISALATVGLTAGVTPLLTVPAQILIIIYMYFGRVGVLTISLGFLMANRAEDRFSYAQTNLLIG
ncbi:MAG: potassium uptake protein, TrkH family [Oscillospiraceae bacterium]|nr:potassium uptake protein, TrkH family [Oscillospiraceae bacterium]